MLCHAVPCSAVLCHAVSCSAVLCHAAALFCAGTETCRNDVYCPSSCTVLQAVVDTTLPLAIEVNRASDIRAVLALTQRDKLPLAIHYATNAHRTKLMHELSCTS